MFYSLPYFSLNAIIPDPFSLSFFYIHFYIHLLFHYMLFVPLLGPPLILSLLGGLLSIFVIFSSHPFLILLGPPEKLAGGNPMRLTNVIFTSKILLAAPPSSAPSLSPLSFLLCISSLFLVPPKTLTEANPMEIIDILFCSGLSLFTLLSSSVNASYFSSYVDIPTSSFYFFPFPISMFWYPFKNRLGVTQ